MNIIKRADRDAALNSLGIDTKDVRRFEFEAASVTVYKLRRDDNGKFLVAGDRVAEVVTTYAVR